MSCGKPRSRPLTIMKHEHVQIAPLDLNTGLSTKLIDGNLIDTYVSMNLTDI